MKTHSNPQADGKGAAVATNSKLYFAKSTMPANGWRSVWCTYAEAVEHATWYSNQWKQCGVDGRAVVFYRDGSCCVEIGGDSNP